MRTVHRILAASLLTGLTGCAAEPPAPVKGVDHVRAIGAVDVDKGVITAKDARVTIVIGPVDADTYRVTAEVKPADKATSIALYLMPADPADTNKPAAPYGSFYHDTAGLQLQVNASLWDAQKKQWGSEPVTTWYTYWPAPADRAKLALMEGSGLAPRHLKDRWLNVRIEAERRDPALFPRHLDQFFRLEAWQRPDYVAALIFEERFGEEILDVLYWSRQGGSCCEPPEQGMGEA